MITSIADLIGFLKHYHRHWLVDPAAPNPVLIPPDLPPGLAAIHRDLGGLIEVEEWSEHDGKFPFSTQDGLAPLKSLARRVDGMIPFAWENSGNWTARCEPAQADPPVYSDAPAIWDDARPGFTMVCPSLNHFLTTLCLQEAMFSSRRVVALGVEGTPDRLIRVPLEPLWLDGIGAFGEPVHHAYATPDRDALVIFTWGEWWVGSSVHEVEGLLAPGVAFKRIG